VRDGQFGRAVWQTAKSNRFARVIRLGRRCQSKPRPNYKYRRVPDAPEDGNRIRRPSLGFLNNDKTLTGKDKPRIVTKQLLSEPEPEPQKTEPTGQEAGQTQQNQRSPIDPKNSRQQRKDKHAADSHSRPV